MTLQHLPFISAVFDENATIMELIPAVIVMAGFWSGFFTVLKVILAPYTHHSQAIHDAGGRDYDNHGKEVAEQFGIPTTRDEHIERYKNDFGWMWGIVIQHFVGGVLCIPSVFGLGDRNMQVGLACLGVVSEVGWEVQDIITLIYRRYFTPNGKAMVPGLVLAIMCIHHALGTGLGLPMIVKYRNLQVFHAIVFNLQGGAAVSVGVAEYTKLLDVSKPRELKQFQSMTSFALLTAILTRAVHWPYVLCQVLYMFYQESSFLMLAAGSCIGVAFSLFSFVAIIHPYYKRLIKFQNKKAAFEAIPDTPETQSARRSSLAALEKAAIHIVYDFDSDDEDDQLDETTSLKEDDNLSSLSSSSSLHDKNVDDSVIESVIDDTTTTTKIFTETLPIVSVLRQRHPRRRSSLEKRVDGL